MGGTWDAWKCFTKLGVWCVRSVDCQIHSFDQQYRRGACATFVRRWHRRSWMNVRKSLGGNWCDGGVFIVKLNLDTIIVQVVVWARIYTEVFRHLYSLCVTYLHLHALTFTPAFCVRTKSWTRSYRNLCFSFYEGEPNENHKKCEENWSPTAWASNFFFWGVGGGGGELGTKGHTVIVSWFAYWAWKNRNTWYT